MRVIRLLGRSDVQIDEQFSNINTPWHETIHTLSFTLHIRVRPVCNLGAAVGCLVLLLPLQLRSLLFTTSTSISGMRGFSYDISETIADKQAKG